MSPEQATGKECQGATGHSKQGGGQNWEAWDAGEQRAGGAEAGLQSADRDSQASWHHPSLLSASVYKRRTDFLSASLNVISKSILPLGVQQSPPLPSSRQSQAEVQGDGCLWSSVTSPSLQQLGTLRAGPTTRMGRAF